MPNQSRLEGDQHTAGGVGKGLSAHANSVPESEFGANGSHYETPVTNEEIEASENGELAYFKTRNFYIVLVLGYVFWNLKRTLIFS